MPRPKQINSTGTKLSIVCGPVVIDLRISGEITIAHREGEDTPAISVSRPRKTQKASKASKPKKAKKAVTVEAFHVDTGVVEILNEE
tara:strand:+ start:277 stop:537 length:261 start_codon:yes stop_codon:yes gene_type:complete